MTTCQVNSKPKRAEKIGGTAHKDAVDSSPFIKGLSPTSAGPLNAFYSAGPVLSLGKPIQRKLTIGQPDDEYEQEADRVADQVMRMPEPKTTMINDQSSMINSRDSNHSIQRTPT